MADRRTRSVAILIDTATEGGRRLIRGIVNYTQQHGPWYLWIRPNVQESPLRLPPDWHGHGIIARVASQAIARHVLAAKTPVVNISAIHMPGVDFPRVTVDLEKAAHLAAEHLLDRGLRHFAYWGPSGCAYTIHHDTFTQAVTEAGFECLTYVSGRQPRTGARRHDHYRDLRKWLCSLPKPIGILTWTYDRGQEVIQACRQADLLVPEEVAVLAADDDSLLCEACQPPLSAMSLTLERTGFEAATMLDRLMRGCRAPKQPTLIEPSPVIERQSTQTLAMRDRDIAQAVAFIRSHAAKPIQVADVLREVALSRRQFERRFQTILGRTPAAEIRRVHMERAMQLLIDSEMPIPDVASAAGFASREYMAQVFKQELGLSPLRYRLRDRGR